MKNQSNKIGISILLLIAYINSTAQYCIPTYEHPCTYGSFINHFSIGDLKNFNSGCSQNNYVNYSDSEYTTDLEQGTTYEVMLGTVYSEGYVRLFFDFNNDSDFQDAGEFFNLGYLSDSIFYGSVSIPNNVSGQVRMRVRFGNNPEIQSNDDCRIMYFGETEDYTVNIVPPFNMTYQSVSVLQNDSLTKPGTNMVGVIRVEVDVTGSLSPLSLEEIDFTTEGTSNVSDITNAQLFYSGTSRSFSSSTSFGSSVAVPNGAFLFSGSQTLAAGKNFFWLTYDVKADAALDNVVDASCFSVKINGTVYEPTNPSPTGNRKVFDYVTIKNGSESLGIMYLCDDGGPDSNYTPNEYVYTIFPAESGKLVQIEFLNFELCGDELGCDELIVYQGSDTFSTVIGVYSDISPGLITSYASDGSITLKFKKGTYDPLVTFSGWKAKVSNVPVPALPTATISGNAIIKKGKTANVLLTMTGVGPWMIIYTNGTKSDTIKNIASSPYTLVVSEPGTYKIQKIVDGLKREGSYTGDALIVIEPDTTPGKLVAPEGISPNGDAFNEYFFIEGNQAPNEVTLYIYNREGGMVYHAENYENDWNGKNSSGSYLPDGTYYYVIYTKDDSQTLKGYLEIRR